MSPPADIDGLSPSELKDLVLTLLAEMAELRRTVAAQRDEIARLKGGPSRPNIKPSGMEQASDPKRSESSPKRPRGSTRSKLSIDEEREVALAAQRPFGPLYASRYSGQLFLGGVEQLAAFARALLGEQRIAADDEALARIVGRGDLGQVALVEQRELDGARRDQALDRRRPQGGDPVEPGRLG